MTLETTTCDAHGKFRFQRVVSLVVGLSGCGWMDRPQLSAEESGISSLLKVETSLHRRLVENSVAVTSVSQPGIVFGLNDSGNGPYVFAFDSTGVGRGIWEVVAAQNRDWEAASLGPCSPASESRSCLYVGDVGDNDARKDRLTVYRFPEPRVPHAGDSLAASPLPIGDAARLDFVYSDQPHDVEAMYVSSDGSIFLITKRRLLDGQHRPRPALLFRLPAAAWDSSGVVTAVLVDSLPLVPGEAQGRQVSDAALSPDGRLLAVRTYADVFIFAVDSASGRPRRDIDPGFCVIAGLRENQGEGIGWWWDQRRLVLTSEGRNAPMYVITCPLPGEPGVKP